MTIASYTETELETQLRLARDIQMSLLPQRHCCLSGWEVAFSYEPAGFVSGDYVDLIRAGDDAFYFALGDVSGKGVAASMLMSHLHATLRTLLPLDRTLEEVVTIASHSFCESAPRAQFATLVLGRADRDGNVELVNAGHNPVLLMQGDEVEEIAAANLPLGMFCSTNFASTKRSVGEGSTLFLYSDGITESTDEAGNEFDLSQLTETLLDFEKSHPSEMVESIHRRLIRYTDDAEARDDRTMLALRFWVKRP